MNKILLTTPNFILTQFLLFNIRIKLYSIENCCNKIDKCLNVSLSYVNKRYVKVEVIKKIYNYLFKCLRNMGLLYKLYQEKDSVKINQILAIPMLY